MAKQTKSEPFVAPDKWKEISEEFWIANRKNETDKVRDIVEGIIEQVRTDGDKALIELTEKFDKVKLKSVRVSRNQIDAAYEKLEQDVVDEIENAAYNIQRFHRMQLPRTCGPRRWSPG